MIEKIYPSDAQERFMIRMPDGMRDRIALEAKLNKRSMNAEIVSILDSHLSDIDARAEEQEHYGNTRLLHPLPDFRKSPIVREIEQLDEETAKKRHMLFVKHGLVSGEITIAEPEVENENKAHATRAKSPK